MKKILWVEDEKDQFDAFSPFVQREHEVTHCYNYVDALSILAKSKFDLYIIDIIIPSGEKNISMEELIRIKDIYYGIELIKKIRSNGDNNPIIVLSVTNHDNRVDEILSIDKNIRVLWKYEVDLDDIKREVDSVLLSR